MEEKGLFCSKACLSSFLGPETQGGRPELWGRRLSLAVGLQFCVVSHEQGAQLPKQKRSSRQSKDKSRGWGRERTHVGAIQVSERKPGRWESLELRFQLVSEGQVSVRQVFQEAPLKISHAPLEVTGYTWHNVVRSPDYAFTRSACIPALSVCSAFVWREGPLLSSLAPCTAFFHGGPCFVLLMPKIFILLFFLSMSTDLFHTSGSYKVVRSCGFEVLLHQSLSNLIIL